VVYLEDPTRKRVLLLGGRPHRVSPYEWDRLSVSPPPLPPTQPIQPPSAPGVPPIRREERTIGPTG